MKTNLLILVFVLVALLNYAQTKEKTKTIWSARLNNLHAIIENKGQDENIQQRKILFAYYKGKEKFYFTNNGIIIRIDTIQIPKGLVSAYFKLIGEEKELYERTKTKSYYLFAEWQNVNPDVQIIPLEKTEGYFTFREHQQLCYGYKKLIYKNIYPNIDIEYTLPTDSAGIKYNIILHPGADLSQVKLLYSGDIRDMSMNNHGNIIVSTPASSIIEHAPKSFINISGKEVGSSFILNNKSISFFLEETNINQNITIDPWVAGTQDSGEDMAYDVDYDFDKNLYAYSRTNGGGLYVTKYSSTGTILWTHLITTESTYDGNFLVDRLSSKIYISEGFRTDGARAYRIDANTAVADGFMSQALSNFREMWDMVFDCTNNRIIGLGGGTNSNLNGGIINTVNGQAQIANFTGAGDISQDVVNGVVDNQGHLFVLYSTGNTATQDRFSLVNNTFNGNIWMTFHGMYSFQECSNHPLWDAWCGAQNSNAFNAMDVNDSYLYMYDGKSLCAYNKANGSSIAATSVGFAGVWYEPIQQGGIAVDDCNNVYLGGKSGNILHYYFDGTSISGPTNIPLNWPGTFVWDIKYDRNSNLLYISGYEGVAVIYAAASASCNNNSLTDSTFCVGAQLGGATVTVHTSLTNPTINYTWYDSGGNIINQTNGSTSLTNTLSNLVNGTYIVRAQVNPLCGPILTDTITINCPICGGTITPSMVSCYGGSDGTATINPNSGQAPFTYLWSNNDNHQTINNLTAGTYTVTLTDANSCTSVISTTITEPAALQSTTSIVNVTCFNGNNGSATVNTIGGTPPYTVLWTNGQTDSTATNLAAGNYTVTITDAHSCTTTQSVTITQPPQLTITASASPSSICPGANSTLTASGAVSYNWDNGLGSGNSLTVSPSATTAYHVTGT
ncbi:MAG: SprB repeat-containing protein, partial [Bacteroidales bacterium]|nr:SprB repeat-containing protein [Bacteroidales bacterium]